MLDAIYDRLLPLVSEIEDEHPEIDVDAALLSVLTWRVSPCTPLAKLIRGTLTDHAPGLELAEGEEQTEASLS